MEAPIKSASTFFDEDPVPAAAAAASAPPATAGGSLRENMEAVDVVILMDCTGSMGAWIAGAKASVCCQEKTQSLLCGLVEGAALAL